MRSLTTTFRILLLSLSVLLCPAVAPAQQPLFNLYAHVLVGGSYLTENYRSCFHEISDLNTVMGPAGGLGVGVRFNLRSFLGLGTELNFTRNSDKMDIAVVGDDNRSVSNVFQRNVYWRLDIPVYLSYITRFGAKVEWNVDAGLYYAYGTGGSQKNNIYHTTTNDLGQLMMSMTSYDTGFYNDPKAFINYYRRGDIGLHLATGLTFASHLRVGVRAHIGMSNAARTTGIVRPKCHNMDFMAMLGWMF
ncbi:MAG: PorT family protein [Duncaniella sp.]|nr:PorT family protein [Duncaniella sp.]